MTQTPIKIYGVPFSVHTRKVIVAARLKAIPYEVVPIAPVNPATLPPTWRSISPTGLIPVIDDGGFMLTDSTAIALYLERKVPIPALLPIDLKPYASALAIDAWAGSELFRRVVHPIFHNQVVAPRIKQQPGDKTAIDTAVNSAAPEAFAYLESILHGAFLIDAKLSIADLAVVSNLIVFNYLGYRIDAARFPKLAAYFGAHLESPVLAATLHDEKAIVTGLELDTSFLPNLA